MFIIVANKQTHKQTNPTKNITSLPEVKIAKENIAIRSPKLPKQNKTKQNYTKTHNKKKRKRNVELKNCMFKLKNDMFESKNNDLSLN